MTRLPRIAYVLTQDRGGPVDVTVALARSLHERGAADVRIGPRPARDAETVEPLLHPTAVPTKTDVAVVGRVRAQLRAWRPDVVHAQDRRAGLTCAGLSRSAAVGTVVHTYHGVPDDVTHQWRRSSPRRGAASRAHPGAWQAPAVRLCERSRRRSWLSGA